MLTEEDIGKRLDRSLQIEFLEAHLDRDGSTPRHFSGPAKLEIDPRGQLLLTLFAARTEFDGTLFDPGALGDIVPEEQYYRFTGRDLGGREWVADRVQPHITWSGPTGGAVCRVRLPSIVHPDTRLAPMRARSYLELVIPSNLGLPANAPTRITVDGPGNERRSSRLNILTFDSLGFTFTCRDEGSHWVVKAIGQFEALPEDFAWRVVDALRFVCAQDLAPTVIRTASGETTSATILSDRGERPSQQLRFLQQRVEGEAGHHAHLFDKRLAFALGARSALSRVLAGAWADAIRAGSSSLETQSLVLGVAAETIITEVIGSQDPTLGTTASGEDETHWVARIRDVVRDPTCPDRLRRRIEGLMDGYRSRSATSILLSLSNAGVVDPALVPSWKRLRNTSAHGGASLRDGAELLADCAAVTCLLYQLTFHVLGYSGPHCHFGTRGWPVVQYPQRSDSSSASA